MREPAPHILIVDDEPSVIEALTAVVKGRYAAHGAATGKAADTLDRGTGADTLPGSAGDEPPVVDNASDSLAANPGEGTDLVQCRVTYTPARASAR